MTIRELIDDFLGQKRLAFVGVSGDPKDFSRRLFGELRKWGYSVIPVNPHATELDGQPFFARVQDIVPPVNAALLMTPPEITDQVVRDCAEAGITRIWMHRGAGKGAVSQAAIAFCEQKGIRVVPGYCPYMFLPKAGFIHRLHGFFRGVGTM
jgi:predicted CoA-binding protein